MKKILALIVGIAMMTPSLASAEGGSTCQTYNPQLCDTVSNVAAQKTPTATAASTLPFTGLDLWLLVGGGSVLLAGGIVARRLSRDSS